jgi:hypothetical protein
MVSILIQINIFLLIFVSSPAVWITKINKCILETFFFLTSFFIPTGQQRFAVIGYSSRAGFY